MRQGILISVFGSIMMMLSQPGWTQDISTLPAAVIQYADAVYINSTIVTLDDHAMNANPGTIAQAMAVRDERIIGLGTNEEMLKYAGPKTKVIDLLGKMMIPGIVESHVHPQGAALNIAREKYKLRSTPEGFASPADVSTLMSAPKLADVAINKSDISEIVPNYPFVLSSASSILSAPEKNVWVHITRGPDGEPVVKTVVKLQE